MKKNIMLSLLTAVIVVNIANAGDEKEEYDGKSIREVMDEMRSQVDEQRSQIYQQKLLLNQYSQMFERQLTGISEARTTFSAALCEHNLTTEQMRRIIGRFKSLKLFSAFIAGVFLSFAYRKEIEELNHLLAGARSARQDTPINPENVKMRTIMSTNQSPRNQSHDYDKED